MFQRCRRCKSQKRDYSITFVNKGRRAESPENERKHVVSVFNLENFPKSTFDAGQCALERNTNTNTPCRIRIFEYL